MTKAALLRAILRPPGLVPMVGAHDALSAKLIEAAGFPVIWSSSFAVSAAQRAVPDVNLLTMTENLEAAKYINDAVIAPVIADVDNGYGNVVNGVRTVEEYQRAGVKIVIWANQVLRGAVQGMQATLEMLARERRLDALDPLIVPLEEIYRHVGVDEFKAIEEEYLPAAAGQAKAVIIAAGSGKSLLPLTEDRPKCMLDIKGRTILERQIETLRACGVQDIVVVRGYKKEVVT